MKTAQLLIRRAVMLMVPVFSAGFCLVPTQETMAEESAAVQTPHGRPLLGVQRWDMFSGKAPRNRRNLAICQVALGFYEIPSGINVHLFSVDEQRMSIGFSILLMPVLCGSTIPSASNYFRRVWIRNYVLPVMQALISLCITDLHGNCTPMAGNLEIILIATLLVRYRKQKT